MKRGLMLCLWVEMISCLCAQEVALVFPDTSGEAWTVNERGNLVSLRESNEYELARFLNTSPDIARRILGQPKGDMIMLNQGDSLNIDYGCTLAPDRLSGVGRIFSHHLGSPYGQYFFSNYWRGGDDIELSDSQFAAILLYLRQHKFYPMPDTLSNDSVFFPCLVSFYDTPYERCFGRATIYVDTANRVVGFLDYYNFDAKRWGVRPIKHEFYVRLISLFSPASASPFVIRYNGNP